MRRSTLLKLAFLIEGAALIGALLLAWFYGIRLFPLSENLGRDILWGTAGALVPLAFFVLVLSPRGRELPFLRSLRRLMMVEVKALFSEAGFLDIAFISLLAGLAEEALFRGVLQARFGIIPASLMFGIVHAATPAYMVVATGMGFYIGLFFELHQSLLIPVWLHFVYDLGALLYLRYGVPGSDDGIMDGRKRTYSKLM